MKPATEAPANDILRRLPLFLIPALALPALTYVVRPLNPFHTPRPDLAGPVAVAAYWVAESGGKYGIPALTAAMTALLVTRPGLTRKRRVTEAFVVVPVLSAMAAGGALLNEHVVKPLFAVPRPNILELAGSPPGAPALKMSAREFYDLPDKARRSEHLEAVLTPDLKLHELVRAHWVAETGYSFPSGHSFSAMTFATFFLALGLTYCSGRRLWAFYLLVPWAAAVCLSRPVLRVHSPTDICVGAVEGVVTGALAFLVARRVLAAVDTAGYDDS